MVVGKHHLVRFLPFTHIIPVMHYLQERGGPTETSLRDLARFGSPFSNIVCLLGHDVGEAERS